MCPGFILWGSQLREPTERLSRTVRWAVCCGALVGAFAAVLMLPGCGEGDNPFPDVLLNVASVHRAATSDEQIEPLVRLWANSGASQGPGHSRFGSVIVEDPIETAKVSIGELSLEVLFACCKRPRTHVGLLVTNDTSKPVQFRWSGLELTPRAFSWGLHRTSATEAGKELAPQAMYLYVRGGDPILIDKGYPKDYAKSGKSEDAYWLRRLHASAERITADTATQLEVPPHSEAILAACFRCDKIAKADVDLGFLIGEEETGLTFELVRSK